jgi:hypothetical protein
VQSHSSYLPVVEHMHIETRHFTRKKKKHVISDMVISYADSTAAPAGNLTAL